MSNYEVVYTRHRQGWTAQQDFPGSTPLSGPTLADVRAAVRAAAARTAAHGYEFEELVDSGERSRVRLS